MKLSRFLLCSLMFATAASTVYLSAAHADEKVIGYAVPEMSSSFWVSATYGAEDESKILGVQLLKLAAGSDGNAAQQISQIQDLIQRKVTAIIVGATNGDAVKAVVEQAIASGIPVIGLSSPPNSGSIAASVSADHYDMGRIQARCLAKAMGETGEVAMLGAASGQSWADDRIKGFQETIATEFPNIKIVAENRSSYSKNDAIKTTEDWLQRFPDLKGIYSAYDDLAAGAVSALKAADKLKGIKVSTSNLSPTAQAMIRNRDLACSSIQPIVAQGRAAIRIALEVADGKQPKETSVKLMALLVDQSNIDSIDLSSVTAPSDYKP